MLRIDGRKKGPDSTTASTMFKPKRRGDASVEMQGLVSKTIGFVRAPLDEEDLAKTEEGLEEELRRESVAPPPNNKLARFRRKGELVLHSKQVLLLVVILNLADCCLVLGELILDIHYIRELRGETETMNQKFINEMHNRYPARIHDYTIDMMPSLFDQIYKADCHWSITGDHVSVNGSDVSISTGGHANATTRRRRTPRSINGGAGNTKPHQYAEYVPVADEKTAKQSEASHSDDGLDHSNGYHSSGHHGNGNHADSHGDHHGGHSPLEDVAHGLHKASITILGILFIENIAKLFCTGRVFFTKKLEVFDSVVVIVSFIMDLVLLKGLTEFKVQDALYILSFLLPWRVIRVVNSLIVAILDHEHFRLKMLYKEKKGVTEQLHVLKDKEKGWDFHLQKIEQFCESEGIPKWKIRQHTAMGRKQSTVTSMASLALNGFLQGMIMSPDDKLMFDKRLERSFSVNTDDGDDGGDVVRDVTRGTSTSLGVISEDDDMASNEEAVAVNDKCLLDKRRDTNGSIGFKPLKLDETEVLVDNNSNNEDNVTVDVQDTTKHVHKSNGLTSNTKDTLDVQETKPLLVRQVSFDDRIDEYDGNQTDL